VKPWERGKVVATLHVRGVPDGLYERVRNLAAARQRSLSAEIVQLLEQALIDEDLRAEQSALLDSIRRHRYAPPEDMNSVVMLREDRRR
jgi:plasmid stability protein